jgi:hypothetical protein
MGGSNTLAQKSSLAPAVRDAGMVGGGGLISWIETCFVACRRLEPCWSMKFWSIPSGCEGVWPCFGPFERPLKKRGLLCVGASHWRPILAAWRDDRA